jgi:hypothetical protein
MFRIDNPFAPKETQASLENSASLAAVLSDGSSFWEVNHPVSSRPYGFVLPRPSERILPAVMIHSTGEDASIVLEKSYSSVYQREIFRLPNTLPKSLEKSCTTQSMRILRVSAGMTTQGARIQREVVSDNGVFNSLKSNLEVVKLKELVGFLINQQAKGVLIDSKLFAALCDLELRENSARDDIGARYLLSSEVINEAVSATVFQGKRDRQQAIPDMGSSFIGFSQTISSFTKQGEIYACRIKNHIPDAVITVPIIKNIAGNYVMPVGIQWRPTLKNHVVSERMPDTLELMLEDKSSVVAPPAGLLLDGKTTSLTPDVLVSEASREAMEENGILVDKGSEAYLGRFPTFGSECHHYVLFTGAVKGSGGGNVGEENIAQNTVGLTTEGVKRFFLEMNQKGIQIEVPMMAALWFGLNYVKSQK